MRNDLDTKAKYNKFNKKLMATQILVFFLFLALAGYLFYRQIFDTKSYRAKAKRQRSALSLVMRGQILDRNGIKLASDMTTYKVYAITRDYDHAIGELATKLSPVLGISYSKLTALLKKKQPVILLKKDLDKKTATRVRKLGLREISVEQQNDRTYPQGKMLSHVLGYYNAEADVSSGIEYTCREKLENAPKRVEFEKTPNGNIIYNLNTDPLATTTPASGENVTLTIDTAIQHVCETELNKVVKEKQAARGFAMVMNPKNGEILAYAVNPTYNPNNYKQASALSLKNWSLTDIFPPGSTFKILTVATAIELGILNENSLINDTGKVKIGSWEIKNYDYYKNPNPGMIDLVYYFEHSSNVGSVKIAHMIPKQQYYNQLRRFGFGSKTGIDLPGESVGLLPKYTNWDTAMHASMGYGYGASVTAIQMVHAVSAIANDGIAVTPHVIKYNDKELEEKVKYKEMVKPETAQALKRILTKSINHSKGPLNLPHYTVAAKTGTSRKPLEKQKGYSNQLYTSVIGFLPADNPKVLIYVVVDSPKGEAIWGSTVAAPIFREIALQTARIMNIPPDKNINKGNKID